MGTVSVVINTHNYGHFVVEAIESVLAQSRPATEVVVVDDGSTDGTPRILEERFGNCSEVKLLRQQNGGQLSAFVLGLEHATGDVICFLDADDKYESTHVEMVARAFDEHREVDFVFTAHRLFGEAEQLVQFAPQNVSLGYSLIATLKGNAFVGSVTSTLAIRRGLALTLLPVFRQAGPRWRSCADQCLVLGASLAGSLKYYLSAPTVLYRVHGDNAWFRRAHSRDESFARALRRDTFLELLVAHLGLGPSVHLNLVWEFLSIERPTREQYRTYLALNHEVNRSLVRRAKARVRLYQHYARSAATWESPTTPPSQPDSGGGS